jgi:hypothetical protein
MRYCEIFDPVRLGRITLKQYTLMMKAVRLRLLDKERDIHAQAWLNVQAKATKQRGKKIVPYFNSFDEFFKPQGDAGYTPERRQKAEKQNQLKELMLKANNASAG